MLVLDFKVDYRLKMLKGIFVEGMKCLNEDTQKKREEKMQCFLYIPMQVWMLKSLPWPNYTCSTSSMSFYAFSVDLIETINYIINISMQ